jgi:hypothetical protein
MNLNQGHFEMCHNVLELRRHQGNLQRPGFFEKKAKEGES